LQAKRLALLETRFARKSPPNCESEASSVRSSTCPGIVRTAQGPRSSRLVGSGESARRTALRSTLAVRPASLGLPFVCRAVSGDSVIALPNHDARNHSSRSRMESNGATVFEGGDLRLQPIDIEGLWIGRWDSNPRRPVWEIDHRLKTQNSAFAARNPGDSESPSFSILAPGLP
jgi:hypothetical protein